MNKIFIFFRGVIWWVQTGHFITNFSDWNNDISHIIKENKNV